MDKCDKYFNQKLKENYTYITAHTGCEGTPWNSLEHIEAALSSEAEIVEIDIQNNGGLLYLSHDPVENPESRPTLKKCFEMVRPHISVLINCDVKHFGLVKPVIELAKRMSVADRIHFTGQVSNEDAQFLKESGEISGWWNSIFPSADNYARLREAVAYLNGYNRDRVICVEYHMVTPELLEYVRQNGYNFTVWTVDEDEDLKRMMGMGLVNITTKRPIRALEIRKQELGY